MRKRYRSSEDEWLAAFIITVVFGVVCWLIYKFVIQ